MQPWGERSIGDKCSQSVRMELNNDVFNFGEVAGIFP